MIPMQTLIDSVKAAVGTGYEDVTWTPGSVEPQVPGRFAMFAPVVGPGFATEWVTDVQGLEVTIAGEQNDYTSAESLAYAIDRAILASGGSRNFGGTWVVDITRFGSPPYGTEQDDADRYHFVCSYLLEVESGMALDQ